MKAVRIASFGMPHEVAVCAEVADPGQPADDEVVVAVDAFPINPVDLVTIDGTYATRPELPATPGSEAAGRVIAVGAAVADLAVGDRALLMCRANWTQRRKAPASQVIKLPDGIDPVQAAMLKINPETAALMLRGIVALERGEWLIQNAANSAVGRLVARLAKAEGIRTVNVVRRVDAAASLAETGADVILLDGDDLAQRVAEATEDARPRLALDAVGGASTGRLGDCLATGGVIAAYGAGSGEAYSLESRHLLFMELTLRGFWLVPTLGGMSRAEIVALYAELADRVMTGELATEVEATYAIDDIEAALEHAGRPGRSGKVVVTPGGRAACAPLLRGGAAVEHEA